MPEIRFAFFPRSTRIRVHGSDAATFLQGQFTNDLRPFSPGGAAYGLWLDQKGKALGDSHVLVGGGEAFEVVSERSQADVIRTRLEAYIIADEVCVEDASSSTSVVVVAGDGASEAMHALGLEAAPQGRFSSLGAMRSWHSREAGRTPAWAVMHDSAESAALRSRLGTVAREAPVEFLTALRVMAGVPVAPDEIGPRDLPNEGGLEHEAISYTKGCYLGQEVMSRLRNLGRVRRRLFVVHGGPPDDEQLPPLPTTLIGDDGEVVGDLRNAVRSPDGPGAWVGLAMLRVHATEPGMELHLAGKSGPTVRVDEIASGRAWT
jgi:hypothetical protein